MVSPNELDKIKQRKLDESNRIELSRLRMRAIEYVRRAEKALLEDNGRMYMSHSEYQTADADLREVILALSSKGYYIEFGFEDTRRYYSRSIPYMQIKKRGPCDRNDYAIHLIMKHLSGLFQYKFKNSRKNKDITGVAFFPKNTSNGRWYAWKFINTKSIKDMVEIIKNDALHVQ